MEERTIVTALGANTHVPVWAIPTNDGNWAVVVVVGIFDNERDADEYAGHCAGLLDEGEYIQYG